MKKSIMLGTLASTVAIGGTIGASAMSSDQQTNPQNKNAVFAKDLDTEMDKKVTMDTNKMLGFDELQEIVHGQVQGSIDEIELDEEDGIVYFEVEVKDGSVKHEIYVDAYSGKVLNFTKKNEDQSSTTTNDDTDNKTEFKVEKKSEQSSSENEDEKNKNTKQKESTDPHSIISKDEAIETAKQYGDGIIDDVELDRDEGRYEYEVEIEGNDLEVEVKLDAHTGEVLDVEYDD
ncbi:PepSY domain-containing protein [Halalkalibacillus halophilus]|uniref:PepSY domain-containing protein n=1 Tax=Halalkalibacillus halophilus TaxID=392827 RepID=UPI00040F7DE9|nr:PepSY domain-containing protein [Halalkalibacillus halophilus]